MTAVVGDRDWRATVRCTRYIPHLRYIRYIPHFPLKTIPSEIYEHENKKSSFDGVVHYKFTVTKIKLTQKKIC